MDLNEYLDSLGLPAEDRTALAGILSKAGDKATAPLLMRADYTRKTQELAAEKQRLASESVEMNKQLSKALADLESGKATAAQYRARLERIQDEWGVDVSDVLKGEAPVVTTPAGTPTVDPKIIERLDAAERNYGISPLITAKLMDARERYVELFGSAKGFSSEKLLAFAQENKIPIAGDPETGYLGAFERMYKVPERQNELLRETIRNEEKTKLDADFEKRINDLQVGNRTGERAPFVQSGSAVLSERFKNVVHQRTSGETGDDKGGHQPPPQSRSEAEKIRSGGAARFEAAFNKRRMEGIPVGGPEKVKAA